MRIVVAADGACEGDVSLPAGSRLYCSTQMWRGDELERLNGMLQSLRDDLQRERSADAQAVAQGGLLALKSSSAARKALEARIKRLERRIPRPGTTIEVPGPWTGTVILSTDGQLAVQRLVRGLPNPFEEVPEFGVVGSFRLAPCADSSTRLDEEVTTEVEVVVD